MTAFDPTSHPRGGAGRFAAKQHDESEVTLSVDTLADHAVPTTAVPSSADVERLRLRAEADAAASPERAALDAARAEGMHMSDDPRVAARYDSIEQANHHAFARSESGAAYLAASAARSQAYAAPERPIDTTTQSRRAEVKAMIADSAARRAAQRRQTPEDLAAKMSTSSLRAALRLIADEPHSASLLRRTAAIESELARRGEMSAAQVAGT